MFYQTDLTHLGSSCESRYHDAAHHHASQWANDVHLDAIIQRLNAPETLDRVRRLGDEIRHHFQHIVVFGMGGATLCPQSFVALTAHHNPPIFIDYIDPHQLEHILGTLELKHTAFIVISKSGNTVETLAQMAATITWCQEAKLPSIGKHFYVITGEGDHPLAKMGASIGASIIPHYPNIGGRFSLFTDVGLLPAYLAGLDIEAFGYGAKDCLVQQVDIIADGAACVQSHIDQSMRTHVMMPYIQRMAPFINWYRQIWAESLGKGGIGTLPVRAMGTLDQHSQLQLYLDGPNDKFFTMMVLNSAQQGTVLNQAPFSGNTIGDVMVASGRATFESLIEKQRPARLITFNTLDEYQIGALAMHMIIEVWLLAKLQKINPFDQPAVESGKQRTKHLLGIAS